MQNDSGQERKSDRDGTREMRLYNWKTMNTFPLATRVCQRVTASCSRASQKSELEKMAA